MTAAPPRPIPTLETARLVLRPVTHADVPAIFGFFSNPAVVRYWSRPVMTDIMQARRLVSDIRKGYRTGEKMQLGIELRDTGTLLGTCTLFSFFPTCRRAELGYVLGHAHWGHGYMNEALMCLLAYAFDDLNLHRLEADIDPDNAASKRTLLRLGFVLEGHLRERWIVGDTISDSEIYGLLRPEWDRLAPPAATGAAR